MALIPWKNKEAQSAVSVGGLRSEMDRLFDSFLGEAFGSLGTPLAAWGPAAWGPPLDMEETDKQIIVRAEIPGVKPEELELSIQGNALVIRGEKKESQERKEKGYLYQERRYGSFRRELPLPSAVDGENVQAEYKDGVLHVTLHKAQEALARKIQVKSN